MDLAPLQSTATDIASSGAVLSVWNSPPVHFLVGDFQWSEPQRIFWFPAHGDTAADGHVLQFDTAEMNAGAIRFLHRGKLVALLSPIDRAHVEDRDDYRVAWSIWQQVAPVRHALLAEARAACEACGAPDSFSWR